MLFGLGLPTRIYLGVEAVDMRKGFDGLYGLVRDHLGQDPIIPRSFVRKHWHLSMFSLIIELLPVAPASPPQQHIALLERGLT